VAGDIFLEIETILLSASIQIISRANRMFFIQNDGNNGCGNMKSIPCLLVILATPERPPDCSWGLSAIAISNRFSLIEIIFSLKFISVIETYFSGASVDLSGR